MVSSQFGECHFAECHFTGMGLKLSLRCLRVMVLKSVITCVLRLVVGVSVRVRIWVGVMIRVRVSVLVKVRVSVVELSQSYPITLTLASIALHKSHVSTCSQCIKVGAIKVANFSRVVTIFRTSITRPLWWWYWWWYSILVLLLRCRCFELIMLCTVEHHASRQLLARCLPGNEITQQTSRTGNVCFPPSRRVAWNVRVAWKWIHFRCDACPVAR